MPKSLRWLAVALTLLGAVRAQAQPDEPPLNLIVAAAAGSAPDIIARVLGDELRTRLGQTTVVDNKAALENRITDTLIAVICGTSDISELDTLREYWHKNGGEEIIEFYNTWYAENVAK